MMMHALGRFRGRGARFAVMAVAVVSLCVQPALRGARKVYLKLSSHVEISSLNAKLKLFKDMKPAPISSLETRKLTRTRGSHTEELEVYDLKDLWLRDNLVGTWKNDICVVTVYRLNLPIPGDSLKIYKSFVLRDVYDKWKKTEEGKKREWSDAEIAKWLSFVIGSEVEPSAEILKKNAPKKAVAKRFPVKGDADGNEFIYVIATSYEPDKPIVIRYELSGGDLDRNVKAIDASIASCSFAPPPKKNASAPSKERSLSRKSTKKERSAKYIASRDMVVDSIKNMKGWWYFETTNFLLVADIKNQKTARDLAANLERCRSVFEKFYPPAKPFEAVSVARMFKTRDEYVAYLGKKYEWSGGIWMPSKKELVVSPMNWGTRADQRKMMIDTTYHESFHMYIYFACGEKQTAVWFNEGNATFFEGLAFRSGKFKILPTYRQRLVRKIAPFADIPKLLKMSYSAFYSGETKNHYALAWGLMYFLWKGAPVLKRPNNYHEIPRKYYRAMLDTGNGAKATEIAWEGIDMDQFSKDFREFWASNSLVKKAERRDPLEEVKKKTGK